MRVFTFISLWSLCACVAMGADRPVAEMVDDVRQDVAQAARALSQTRREIGEARKPLESDVRRLTDEVATLRRELEQLRRAQAAKERERTDAEDRVRRFRQEHQLMWAAWEEYRRTFEQRLPPAELEALTRQLKPVDDLLEGPRTPERLPELTRKGLATAMNWNRMRLEPFKEQGRAMDADGRVVNGCYLLVGPVSFFSEEGGERSGVCYWPWGASLPAFTEDFKPKRLKSLKQLCRTGEAVAPVDVTGGKVLQVAEARKSWIEHLRSGGAVMVPLLLTAVGSLFIALFKWGQLSSISLKPPANLEVWVRAVKTNDRKAVHATLKALDREHAALLDGLQRHADLPREHLEELAHETILDRLPGLESNLGLLALCGGVAPLLGLLGTVTGMIHTFQLVTVFGTGDAKLLSGGISEALVTTETGLTIAVPVLLAHALLRRRVRRIVQHLEHVAMDLVAALSEDHGIH